MSPRQRAAGHQEGRGRCRIMAKNRTARKRRVVSPPMPFRLPVRDSPNAVPSGVFCPVARLQQRPLCLLLSVWRKMLQPGAHLWQAGRLCVRPCGQQPVQAAWAHRRQWAAVSIAWFLPPPERASERTRQPGSPTRASIKRANSGCVMLAGDRRGAVCVAARCSIRLPNALARALAGAVSGGRLRDADWTQACVVRVGVVP